MAKRNNPFQGILDIIPAPFRNKYFIALLLFFAWMIFPDRHDVITQYRLQNTVEKLEKEREFYKAKILEAEQQSRELDRDPEKIAREKYFMKKRNEDVFIIEKKDDKR